MLIKAKEEGIVQIKIVHQRYNLLSLEETLKDIFHLDDAVIVPSNYFKIYYIRKKNICNGWKY